MSAKKVILLRGILRGVFAKPCSAYRMATNLHRLPQACAAIQLLTPMSLASSRTCKDTVERLCCEATNRLAECGDIQSRRGCSVGTQSCQKSRRLEGPPKILRQPVAETQRAIGTPAIVPVAPVAQLGLSGRTGQTPMSTARAQLWLLEKNQGPATPPSKLSHPLVKTALPCACGPGLLVGTLGDASCPSTYP